MTSDTQYPASLASVILDKAQRDHYQSLAAYLAANAQTPPVTQNDLASWQASLEANLALQAEQFSYLVYKKCLLSGNWTDAGEQQVKTAFCRNILKIDVSIPLAYEHLHKFESKLAEKFVEFDLENVTLDWVEEAFKNAKFTLLGTDFSVHDFGTIHEIMRFIESPYFLQGGFYGHDVEMIFGKGEWDKRDDYEVIYLTEELHRTPNTVMCMVAVIGEKQVYVRKEATESIFYQKWMAMFDGYNYGYGPEFDISTAIKKAALAGYDAHDEPSLLAKKDDFLHDMRANVCQHELGHGVIQHRVLPQPIATIMEATKVCGETIGIALLEILAEMAPKSDALWGPLYNMALTAKTNKKAAEREFWGYLSDTWFYDTEDLHMLMYSDLVTLVMGSVLKPSATIDFEALEAALTWQGDFERAVAKPVAQKNLLELAVSLVKNLAEDLESILTESSYTIDDKTLSFDEAKAYFAEKALTEMKDIVVGDYGYDCAIWSELMDLVYKSESGKAALDACFAKHEQAATRAILQKVAASDAYETHKEAPRGYVMAHYSQILDLNT